MIKQLILVIILMAPTLLLADQEKPKNSDDEKSSVVRFEKHLSWTFMKGETLQTGMRRWCDQQGWDLIWDSPIDYPIIANARFDATDINLAFVALAEDLRQQRNPLNIRVASNKVVRVTGGYDQDTD